MKFKTAAWLICPNGDVLFSSKSFSHLQLIQEIGIEQQLLDASDKIPWSKDELHMKQNIDVVSIALKLGYIRILQFNTQIAILLKSQKILKENKNIISKLLYQIFNMFIHDDNLTIIIEIYDEKTYNMFSSYQDFDHFISKI